MLKIKCAFRQGRFFFLSPSSLFLVGKNICTAKRGEVKGFLKNSYNDKGIKDTPKCILAIVMKDPQPSRVEIVDFLPREEWMLIVYMWDRSFILAILS